MLKIIENLFLDSREVANMVEKRHSDLLRDIERYIGYFNQNAKLRSDDFFIKSQYITGTGKAYKVYNISKKGCEFIAHKLTGKKGTIFTATYINRFHEMEKALNEKPKQQMLDLNNRLYFGLFTVLTIKGLSELSGIDEADIRYAISKLNLRPMLLREDSLEEFKERNRIPFKHVSQLTILGFNESKQILKLFKKDHLISLLKEYFNDNNKVKVIETTQDKDISVKMVSKCIELYDKLIDMSLEKLYETKGELFTKNNYPQHIKKLIFSVFNTVELKKLNI